MSKKEVGSPPKYSEELLLAKIDELLLKNPIEKLNPNSIAKFTGIPRHVWMRRMDKQIKTLKEPTPNFLGRLKKMCFFQILRK